MNCPNCGEPLAERGVFCKACATQAKCIKCQAILEPGAIACVECGTRIGDDPVDPSNGATTSSHPVPPNRNNLSYREDRNSRHFEASLTDSAMHGLGDVFAELFAQRGVGRVVQHGALRTFAKDTVIEEAKQLPPSTPTGTEQQPTVSEPSTEPTPSTDQERVLKIFSANGETLELIDNRLKATTAADYYRRLTYLLLYAHELHGRASTPKSELIRVLKEAKVYDSNCRVWLKQKKGFTSDGEDRLKLIASAREQAVKTLDEILDGNIQDQWNPDNRTMKPRKPNKKKA